MVDLGQTSRTIYVVDKVREAGPSQTLSPSVGSFQDMAFRKPTHDDTAPPRVPLPLPTLPSQRATSPCAGEEIPHISSKFQEMEPNRSVPDIEADATSDELQVQERRSKSRNDTHRSGREDAVTPASEEVIGRLKRKKGHLKVYPQERVIRLTSQEDDAGLKRNRIPGGSRQSNHDFEDDSAEDSDNFEEGAGKDSDGDINDTPTSSLGVPRGKEPAAPKSGHEVESLGKGNADHSVGKTPPMKKGKRGPRPNRRNLPMKTRAASQKGRQ